MSYLAVVVDVQNPGFSQLKQEPSQVHQLGLTSVCKSSSVWFFPGKMGNHGLQPV